MVYFLVVLVCKSFKNSCCLIGFFGYLYKGTHFFIKNGNAPQYFLSVQELLLVAESRQINVLVVSWDPATRAFHSQGHVHAGVNPYVLILLKGTMQKRGTVRSHYERLFRLEDRAAGAEALRTRETIDREQSQMGWENEYGHRLRARWKAEETERRLRQ